MQTPPITPGRTSRTNSRQSTLRCATWLIAETMVVKVSAVWTPAEAAAGGTPVLISSVLEIWPNAMPSAPSTSCAAKPISAKITSAVGSAKMSGTMAEVPLLERRSLPQRAKARQVAGLGQCDAVAGNRATQHLNWER